MQQIFSYHSRTANSTRDDDRDEVSSTVSYLSDISGLSEMSGQEWKPVSGRFSIYGRICRLDVTDFIYVQFCFINLTFRVVLLNCFINI
jgi:hypothetical protein